jgi:hypothetical protein
MTAETPPRSVRIKASLMTEEESNAASTTEIDHWIDLYTELLLHTSEVLGRARRQLASYAAEIDLLERYLDDLDDRLAFWRMNRAAQLLNGR